MLGMSHFQTPMCTTYTVVENSARTVRVAREIRIRPIVRIVTGIANAINIDWYSVCL